MKYNLQIRKIDVLLLKLIESSVRKMYEPQLRNNTSNAIFESKLFFARSFLHDTRCSLTCTFDQLAWKIDSRLIHVMNFVSVSRTRRSHSSARGISISETVPLSTGYCRVSRASFLKFCLRFNNFRVIPRDVVVEIDSLFVITTLRIELLLMSLPTLFSKHRSFPAKRICRYVRHIL